MMKEYLPNYKDGSIVNLMSSIEYALGGKSKYGFLKMLTPDKITNNNILLIQVDALAYNYLKKYGKNMFMNKYCKGKITSIFPTTSPAAAPCFLTGQTAGEHGMLGHTLYIKELGGMVRALRNKGRGGADLKMKPMKSLYDFKSVCDRIKVSSYTFFDEKIVDTELDTILSGKAKRVGIKDAKDMFDKINGILDSDKKRKFMFALWSEHDYLLHDHRSKSNKVLDNLKMFDKLLKEFVSNIKGTDTMVIVTADHGMIDVPDNKMIWISDHPKLKECLRWTMNGQQRYLYCHIKKDKKEEFVSYVKKNLPCKILSTQEILDMKLFGLFSYHKDIKNRIGDYVLIPRDDYAFYDLSPGEERDSYGLNYGDHGGLSSDEMFVPLIVIKA